MLEMSADDTALWKIKNIDLISQEMKELINTATKQKWN